MAKELRASLPDRAEPVALVALAWGLDPRRDEPPPPEVDAITSRADELPSGLKFVPHAAKALRAIGKRAPDEARSALGLGLAVVETPASAVWLGTIALELGDEALARKAALAAVQFSAAFEPARALAARVALLGGRLDEALKATEDLDASSPDVAVVRAATAYERVDPDGVARALEALSPQSRGLAFVSAFAMAGELLAGRTPEPSKVAVTAGAQKMPVSEPPAGAMVIAPGKSIQEALDKLGKSGGTLSLKAGVHTLPETLRVPSGVSIVGSGIDCELFLDPTKAGQEAAMINDEPDMHDVVLRNFVIEGGQTPEASTDPNVDVAKRRVMHGPIRAGIVFQGTALRNLTFEHITVRNCTYNAVELFGAEQVNILNCDISGSGGMVPPGPGKNHNLKMNHVSRVVVTGSRFADAMWGHGIAVIFGSGVEIRDCELTRNALDGVMIAESRQVMVEGCLAEGNGGTGIAQETWMDRNQDVVTEGNILRNNVVAG